MGDLKTHETGDFYLETNKEKPFARKRGGFGLKNVFDSLPTNPLKVF